MRATVRTANLNDEGACVPLILLAGGSLLTWGMAGRADLAEALVRSCWGRPGHPVGPSWTLVATVHDRVVGALLGGRADRWTEAERRLAEPLDPAIPPGVRARIEEREGLQGSVRPPLPPDCWYVASLAVDAAWRGHGFATQLLETARARAAAEACRCQIVEVEADNDPARRLYLRAGFRDVGSWKAPGGPRVRRMST